MDDSTERHDADGDNTPTADVELPPAHETTHAPTEALTPAAVEASEPSESSESSAPGATAEAATPPMTPHGPVPTPAAVRRPTPAAARAETRSEGPSPSEAFGRVDDDGNIFVLLPDGNEHFVGQWAAGDPVEGLRLYAHRYDDYIVDVDLAGQRLMDGRMSPEDAQRTLERIREALIDPKIVGDLADLAARLKQLDVLIGVRREAIIEEKAQAKQEALATREALVSEAEQLSTSTSWRQANERFRTIVEEWKSVPRFDRGVEQDLWTRLSAARSSFDRARRQHFQTLEKEHAAAKAAKKDLVTKAEALKDSTDWAPTAAEFRNLMDKWKKAGFAGKPDDDKLWKKFRAAQEAFFSARKAALDERDASWEANLAAKRVVVERAEALLPVKDPVRARREFRACQGEFAGIGHVPRADKPRLDGRMAKVDAAIRESEQEQWRRSDPEKSARAEGLAAMYEQSVERLREQVRVAEQNGDDATELRENLQAQEQLLAAARKYVWVPKIVPFI
jgi:hypothetical protein